MALALTILAIALASLALGVQLADLRAEREEAAADIEGDLQPAVVALARNDNEPTAISEGITLVRRPRRRAQM